MCLMLSHHLEASATFSAPRPPALIGKKTSLLYFSSAHRLFLVPCFYTAMTDLRFFESGTGSMLMFVYLFTSHFIRFSNNIEARIMCLLTSSSRKLRLATFSYATMKNYEKFNLCSIDCEQAFSISKDLGEKIAIRMLLGSSSSTQRRVISLHSSVHWQFFRCTRDDSVIKSNLIWQNEGERGTHTHIAAKK